MGPRRRDASAKQPAQDSRDPAENAVEDWGKGKGKLEKLRKEEQINDEVRD